MPIFEYKCKKCGKIFEEIVLSSNEDINCPECKTSDVKKLISAGAVRPDGIPKGSGGFQPPPPSCGGAGAG
ncbi:MAG: FmdB family zinc ribbon protein [Thermodesulfobacteriota bacterium]